MRIENDAFQKHKARKTIETRDGKGELRGKEQELYFY